MAVAAVLAAAVAVVAVSAAAVAVAAVSAAAAIVIALPGIPAGNQYRSGIKKRRRHLSALFFCIMPGIEIRLPVSIVHDRRGSAEMR